MLPKLEAVLAVGAPSVELFTSPMNTEREPAPNSAVQIASPSVCRLKLDIDVGVTLVVVTAPVNGLPGTSPS
jgi:hypothetical protein